MNSDARCHSVNEVIESFEDLLQTIVGIKFYSKAKEFAGCHPFIFAAIIVTGLFSLVPLLVFLAFTVTTLFIALLCFLCIEGSIIAIGGIIFIGVVAFISVIVASIMSAIAVAYFFLQKIRMLIKLCLQTSGSSSQNQVVATGGNKSK